MRPGSTSDKPAAWDIQLTTALENSWGFVLFPTGQQAKPLFATGVSPPELIGRFAHRKAFISLLEALAQCLPFWALWQLLKQPYWAYIDNTSAQHALIRGYSTNPAANFLVWAFWAAAARAGAGPWFERVASGDNISDGISRLDFAMARRDGWRELPFVFDGIYHALVDAIDRDPLNVTTFVTKTLANLTAQRVAMGLPAE